MTDELQPDTEPEYRCGECRDTGFRDESPTSTTKVVCECQDVALYRQLLAKHGINKRLAGAQGKNYFPNPDYPAQALAQTRCKEWVLAFKPECPGILLYGDTGTGKSHLAMAMFKAILQKRNPETGKRYSGICWNTKEFVKVLQKEINGTDDHKIAADAAFENASHCGILLLDDLGDERQTVWAQSQIELVIDRRYRNEKPTIITSNLDPITTMERRMASRISELCDFGKNLILLDGPDYRMGVK